MDAIKRYAYLLSRIELLKQWHFVNICAISMRVPTSICLFRELVPVIQNMLLSWTPKPKLEGRDPRMPYVYQLYTSLTFDHCRDGSARHRKSEEEEKHLKMETTLEA